MTRKGFGLADDFGVVPIGTSDLSRITALLQDALELLDRTGEHEKVALLVDNALQLCLEKSGNLDH